MQLFLLGKTQQVFLLLLSAVKHSYCFLKEIHKNILAMFFLLQCAKEGLPANQQRLPGFLVEQSFDPKGKRNPRCLCTSLLMDVCNKVICFFYNQHSPLPKKKKKSSAAAFFHWKNEQTVLQRENVFVLKSGSSIFVVFLQKAAKWEDEMKQLNGEHTGGGRVRLQLWTLQFLLFSGNEGSFLHCSVCFHHNSSVFFFCGVAVLCSFMQQSC